METGAARFLAHPSQTIQPSCQHGERVLNNDDDDNVDNTHMYIRDGFLLVSNKSNPLTRLWVT